jgi:hypothetical protein
LTTVLKVIERAYRRSGVKGMSAVITAAQKDVGLERLQDLFMDLSNGTFGALHDKRLTTNAAYTACEFERVINTAGAVVSLPATVQGDSCDPQFDYDFGGTSSARTPVDGCVIVVVVPGVSSQCSIYDSSAAAWQRVDALALNDECPLTNRWSDAVTNILATYLADDVGTPLSPGLAKKAVVGRMGLATRYGSIRRNIQHEFF